MGFHHENRCLGVKQGSGFVLKNIKTEQSTLIEKTELMLLLKKGVFVLIIKNKLFSEIHETGDEIFNLTTCT